MSPQVRFQPEGYHSVTPYLIIQNAAAALDFYKRAFGATELMRLAAPDGKIGHAEIKIGDSIVMLADEHPDLGFRAPPAYGGTPVSLMIYVPDVDAVSRQAEAAGAKVLRPVANQFYGDRTGIFQDPFGHVWSLATHQEDLTPEEISRRAKSAGY